MKWASAKRSQGVSEGGRQDRGHRPAVLAAIFCAGLLTALAGVGCEGPGLEPPTEGQAIGSSGAPGVLNPPVAGGGAAGQGTGPFPGAPNMAAGGSGGGAAQPPSGGAIGSAGTSAGGSSGSGGGNADPGGASGGGGSGGATSEPPNDPDGGVTNCEAERWPALGLGQRIIGPWLDGGLGGNACEYELPDGAAPYLPDHVNLQHTLDGRSTSVPRVADVTACDPTEGGFYYDNPQAPMLIIACTATCTRFGQGGEVDIVLGCPTATRP